VLSEEDYFSSLLLLVLIANHIATLFDLRTLFLRLPQDADSLCGWGANYAYNSFTLSWGHFRLIAGTDGWLGQANNWLALQAYGRQTSHGAYSISDTAPMREMPHCHSYDRGRCGHRQALSAGCIWTNSKYTDKVPPCQQSRRVGGQ
jgi:hypothetical protein